MTDGWSPGPRTRLAGVIGHPVRHSLSPAMHNAAFRALDLDWAYLAFDVAAGEGAAAVGGARALGLEGLSVTMPHKEDAAGAVDLLSPAADALRAVNTVVRRPGDVLEGHNTDGAGFVDALLGDEGFDPAGRRCLVLGAGGAARAVVRALAEAGAAEVVVANRTESRAAAAAALAGPVGRVGAPADAAGAELVVNATPVGMGGVPAAGAEVLDLEGRRLAGGAGAGPPTVVDPSCLGPGQLVVDLVYHPPLTPLLEAARDQGAAAVNGLGMLIHQAALAFRLWTGEDPPLAVMSAAALGELARKGGGP
ncbi:MAG: shikimate dehydrogenase [Acidimicrobiales bacterium]